jgi:hypothetical protein
MAATGWNIGGPGRIYYEWPATVGLKILGARGAERLVPPSFRRQMVSHGLYKWIAFPKAFSLSSPRMAATFTALSATVRWTATRRAVTKPPAEIERGHRIAARGSYSRERGSGARRHQRGAAPMPPTASRAPTNLTGA